MSQAYRFMGVGEPETFRCRVYDSGPDEDDRKRIAFVERLNGDGVIDCPAYAPWIEKLQERGWLATAPELERNPDGPGKIGRWKLTDFGRREWEAMR